MTHGNFNDTATKRAILDYGSTTDQSSQFSSSWATEKWANIKSKKGFWNYKTDTNFWINVIFPGRKHFEVETLILKKIPYNDYKHYLINGVVIEYQSGGKWIQFNGGSVIKTGMSETDDTETEYIIDFYPPFLATQVKAYMPRSEISH